jgi:hypothetical protein
MSDTIPIIDDTDALRWAREFSQAHGGDEATLLVWFVNAIETGKRQGETKARAEVERLRAERDVLVWAAQEWLHKFAWDTDGAHLYTDEQTDTVAALLGEEAER